MTINKNKIFNKFYQKAENRQIDFIVLHHIGCQTLELAIDELKKHQVSSHYIIAQNGEIFQLVEDKNIAYHAGVSFWQGIDGLNPFSIGIEFHNPKPFSHPFSKAQIDSGLELCQKLMLKYGVKKENVVGHNEIAYCKKTDMFGRKQDPSHLFPWEIFYEKNLTFYRL